MNRKIGIYLNYRPNQVIKSEGIGRLLCFLISGIILHSSVNLVVALPTWFKTDFEGLLRDNSISRSDRIEFITTGKIPYWLRIMQWWDRWRLREKSKRKKTLTKKGKNLISVAFINLISQKNTFIFVGLLVFYSLIGIVLLPFIILSGVFVIGKKGFGKKFKKKIKYIFYRFLRSILPRFYLKDIYDAVNTKEANNFIEVLNARNDIELWFVPCLFWQETIKLKTKKVMALPDVVFADFPTQFNNEFCNEIISMMKNSITGSDAIICYSEYVKRHHATQYLGFDEEKTIVIPHGHIDLGSYLIDEGRVTQQKITQKAYKIILDYQKKYLQSNVYLRDFDFFEVPFLIYPSQLRPHKNIMNLIKAIEILIRKRYLNIKLILTANLSVMEEVNNYIRENKLNYDIIALYGVSTEVLAALYHLAICSINPTLFEGGFPFTFSEAYSVETPSVMSSIPVVLEQIVDTDLQHAMLFDPYNVMDMVDKIEWAINNYKQLYARQKYLYEDLKKRNWVTVAGEYLSVFDRVIEEKPLGTV